MTHKNDRVLSVTELARVEGEGALYIRAIHPVNVRIGGFYRATPSSPASASRRSATTTRASPARLTSWI
jgi:hypothetical protein